ncbi:hypothetical protein PCASD_02012 [Puccinia coronata f. sp. avenae]|uniref:Uncharacterized protein n=2 Tax=Puccinia coronata f. sp. avenae TaxID=200324 RepID=A0A2N5VHM0_9BASI|nr:hypothetical protein PCASD_02012 [Puccinia coronata f. sp. avenae]
MLPGSGPSSQLSARPSMKRWRDLLCNGSQSIIKASRVSKYHILAKQWQSPRKKLKSLLKDIYLTIKGHPIAQHPAESHSQESETYVAMPTADASRVALVDTLGKERRDRVLAAVYITRQDSRSIVRTTLVHIWKALVNNTPKTAREVMPVAGPFFDFESQALTKIVRSASKLSHTPTAPCTVPLLFGNGHGHCKLCVYARANALSEPAGGLVRGLHQCLAQGPPQLEAKRQVVYALQMLHSTAAIRLLLVLFTSLPQSVPISHSVIRPYPFLKLIHFRSTLLGLLPLTLTPHPSPTLNPSADYGGDEPAILDAVICALDLLDRRPTPSFTHPRDRTRSKISPPLGGQD